MKVRIGFVAAGIVCMSLAYAAAQQSQSTELAPGSTNAPGQADSAIAPQPDSPTTQIGDPTNTGPNQRQTNFRAARAAAGGHQQVVDHFLANCLLGQNEAEVQLSQLALQKSENAEVKQFAQKMIDDHRKMIEQLTPLAATSTTANRTSTLLGGESEAQGRSESTVGRTSDTTAVPGSSSATQTIPPTGTSAAVPPVTSASDSATNATANATMTAGGGAVHQLMQIDKQINERCLQMARDEMQQKSGADFDKCFVGFAIGAHNHALAALEVIGKQTQGTLAQVAQQAQPTVQQHLQHAKALMKQLDGPAAATAQRETNRTE